MVEIVSTAALNGSRNAYEKGRNGVNRDGSVRESLNREAAK